MGDAKLRKIVTELSNALTLYIEVSSRHLVSLSKRVEKLEMQVARLVAIEEDGD